MEIKLGSRPREVEREVGRLPEGKPVNVCAPDLLFSTDASERATGLPEGPSAEDPTWVCGP